MAELTLLVNSTDTALLGGNVASPAAANGVAADAPVAGGFSGVLGKQLRPNENVADTQSPPTTDEIRSAPVTETGEPRPVDGKALPSAESPAAEQDTDADSPLLNTSLLSVIAQDVSATGLQPLAVTPVLDPAQARLNDALQSSLPTLATAQSAGQNATAVQSSGNSAVPPALLNLAVNTLTLATAAQGTTPVLTNVAEDAQRVAVSPVIPALLGKPVSTAQQQALERATLNSGKAGLLSTGLRADMISANGTVATNAQQNNGLSSSLTGVNNPMGNTLRMDIFTAAMGAAAQTNNELRLPTSTAATPLPGSLTATNVLPEGAFVLPADGTRLPGTVGNAFSPTLAVSTPVGQPAWASELGQRVTWLANNELREAKLQLNPRSLGAVDVRIAFGPEQQLTVSFSAANPIARDALDASLPRLREMFEQQGLQLADANISHESPKEREHRNGVSGEAFAQGSVQSEDDELTGIASLQPSSLHRINEGMLDAYA